MRQVHYILGDPQRGHGSGTGVLWTQVGRNASSGDRSQMESGYHNAAASIVIVRP